MEDEEIETFLYHLSLILLNSISSICNFLIIIIFLRFRNRFFPKQRSTRRLRSTRNHNRCLLSMVFADLLVGFFGTLTGILLRFAHQSLVYKLFGLIPLYGCMFTSVFSLILLTTDRLVAIKYPFSYKSFMENSRITASVALCWIIPLLTTAINIIFYVTNGMRVELTIRNTMLTVVSLTGFIVLAILNSMLIHKVRQQSKRSVRLRNASCRTRTAYEGAHFNGKIETSAEEESNQAKCKPDMSTSYGSVLPSYEIRRFSSLEILTTSNEVLQRHRHTVAFCTSSGSLNLLTEQKVKRHTFSESFNKFQTSEVTRNFVDIFSLFHDRQTESTHTLQEPLSEEDLSPVTLGLTKEAEKSINMYSGSSTRACAATNVQRLDFQATGQPEVKSERLRGIPERKITTMCICIIVTFLICWLPLVGYRFSYVAGRTTQVPWFRRLTQCLALTNSLFNPFIYFMVRKDFRELLKNLFRTERKQY